MRIQRVSPGSAGTEPGWFLMSAPGIGGDTATSVLVVCHQLELKKTASTERSMTSMKYIKTMLRKSNLTHVNLVLFG